MASDPVGVRAQLAETAPTLLVGAAGAAAFAAAGFPAPMLTGPAAAVSVASLLGLKSGMSPILRDAIFIVLGVQIGGTVTPEVIDKAMAWPVSLAMLAATLLTVMGLVRLMLVRGFGYDRLTALLAAAPGHLSFVLGLSAELRCDVPRVALVQSVRVLMLTLLVPLIIAWSGAAGTARLPDYGTMAAVPVIAVFAGALALGLGLRRLRVPAPLLLGGMAVSAIGHGTEITPGILPPWLTLAAFVGMGSLIGTRFRGLGRTGLLGALAAGVLATLIACAVAAAGAILAARIVDLPPSVLLLAFAPGGVEVMAAIAIETGLEPAVVAAHHVMRLVILSAVLPVMLARVR